MLASSDLLTNMQPKVQSNLWKSTEGRERLAGWYDHFLKKVDLPIDRVVVKTSIGESGLLIVGDEEAPPLVCLHGMRTGAAFLLSEITALAVSFRLYVPDIPGQSVIGPDVRMPVSDHAHANWLKDVIDELSLASVHLFGVSWGGYVARLMATAYPDRILSLSMLCPAGVVNGSHLTGLAKMMWPLIRHKLRPTERSLRTLLAPIMTTWDDDWAGAFDCALHHLKMDARVPPLATDHDLRELEMPMLVMAGEEDISFPGEELISRVRRLVPDADTELIENCKHCPPTTDAFRSWLATRVSDFVQQPTIEMK
ncbi:MAG: alpha/beta hydrolase [Planctomycetota bacterium]